MSHACSPFKVVVNQGVLMLKFSLSNATPGHDSACQVYHSCCFYYSGHTCVKPAQSQTSQNESHLQLLILLPQCFSSNNLFPKELSLVIVQLERWFWQYKSNNHPSLLRFLSLSVCLSFCLRLSQHQWRRFIKLRGRGTRLSWPDCGQLIRSGMRLFSEPRSFKRQRLSMFLYYIDSCNPFSHTAESCQSISSLLPAHILFHLSKSVETPKKIEVSSVS